MWREAANQGSVAKFVSLSDNWPILVIEKSDDKQFMALAGSCAALISAALHFVNICDRTKN